MATIQIKRNKSNATTKPTSLLEGELAINLLDRSLYSNDGSSIIQLYTGTSKWFDTSGNANNANKLGGVAASSYLTGITSSMVTNALGYTPYNSADFTKANIKSTLGIADWALAASKPSYTFSEITGKPTTLSGYGITDAITTNGFAKRDLSNATWGTLTSANGFTPMYWLDSVTGGGIGISDAGGRSFIQVDGDYYANEGRSLVLHTANFNNYALPLSGGTITGPLTIQTGADTKLIFNNTDGEKFTVCSFCENGTQYAGLLVNSAGFFYNDQHIIHSGNYSSYALPLSGGTMTSNSKIKWGDNVQSWDDLDNGFTGISTARDNDYYAGLSFKGWYGFQIRAYGGDTDLIQARGATNTAWGTWRTLIHSGNIGSQSVDRAIALRGIYPSVASTNDMYNTELLLKYHAGFSPDFGNAPESNSWQNGLLEIGLHSGGASAQFFFSAYKRLYYRSHQSDAWHGVAYLTDNVASATQVMVNYSYNQDVNYPLLFTSKDNIGVAKNGSLYTDYYGKLTYNPQKDVLTVGNVAGNASSATKLQTARTIWGQSFDGTENVSGVITMPVNHQIQWVDSNSMIYGDGSNITISNTGNLAIATSGNVLIGTATDSGNGAKLQVSGLFSSTGDGVFGSDARYKSKLQDLAVDIETIANAPVFSYKWTDREDDKVHLGTTAQYWLNTNFKDAVDISNKDFYHLNYGALGVAIGVSLAKKTVNHEERIKELEERVKNLEIENKQLRQWRN